MYIGPSFPHSLLRTRESTAEYGTLLFTASALRPVPPCCPGLYTGGCGHRELELMQECLGSTLRKAVCSHVQRPSRSLFFCGAMSRRPCALLRERTVGIVGLDLLTGHHEMLWGSCLRQRCRCYAWSSRQSRRISDVERDNQTMLFGPSRKAGPQTP